MSGSKRKPSEGIWEINQKITKLEFNSIIGNPAFPGINQQILFYLDHESQMAFRQVCQSWKEQLTSGCTIVLDQEALLEESSQTTW